MAHSEKNEPQNAGRKAKLKMPTDQPCITPYVQKLIDQYPDVPEPHNRTWGQSDEHTRKCTDWQDQLKKTADALVNAIQVCQALASDSSITTPSELKRKLSILRSAVYKTESVLEELGFMYPLPQERGVLPEDCTNLPSDRSPRLLANEEDRILIWMPHLPQRQHFSSSNLLAELTQLLRVSDLHHMSNWHCDFLHVFPCGRHLGVRDVDNYPYKPIIDALTLALAAKDSADHFSCAMYNLFTDQTKPGCYILISKRSKKVGFFTDFEKFAATHLDPQKEQEIPEKVI